MKKPAVYKDSGEDDENTMSTAGLLATDIALVLQFLQLNSLDIPLTVSLYLVAPSIPLLVLHYFACQVSKRTRVYFFPRYSILVPVAWLASLVAVGAAIFHFLPIAAYLFGGAAAFSVGAYLHYCIAAKELAEKTLTKDSTAESET